MRVGRFGSVLLFVVSLAPLLGGCAEAEESPDVESAASVANDTGAPVTLTSARSESSRPSFLAHGTRSNGRELREMASWKARCEASDDADACDRIARSRLR